MAKDTIQWGADDAPVESIKWGANDAPVTFGESDTPVDQPVSAQPSVPTRASDGEIDQLAMAGVQSGSAAAQFNAVPPLRRRSVLEGVYMPEQPFDPAEGERLSLRRNAEQADIDAAQAGAPSMRATPTGPQARPTGDGMLGRAGDLIKSQTYSAASGLARHGADAAGAVGAEGVAADLKARALAASEKSRQLNQGVELERAARRFETVSGFAPGSVVQDSNRFANEYLPQILAQGQQVPMALFGGLTPLVGMSYLSSYADARDAGKSPAEALAYAVPQASAEYVGEKVGGMGRLNAAFEKAVSTGFARDAAWRDLGRSFLAAGAKEVPSEELTFGLQFINDKFSPVGLQPNATWEDFKKGAADTAIVAMGSGGMMAGAGAMMRPRREEPQQSAEQLARVQRLRDAGEKEAADLLEKRFAAQRLPAEVDRELAGLQLPAAQTSEFQEAYRGLRTAGVKPAEAAARTAVITDFRAAATAAGMSDKAIAAAFDAGQKKGLDELPAFLNRFTQSLASRGAVQAVDIGPQLEAARDAGLDAATESLYGDVRPTMEAAQALEAQQDAAPPATEPAGPAPALETGNDIAVTPEADAVHAAATSPLNDLPEPTQAQKDAGNYPMGHLRISAMPITVENPQGSVRSGKDVDGKPWETPMTAHYGYLTGTIAADSTKGKKQGLDVFVKPGTSQDFKGPIFVVDQVDPATGALDEHKIILGAMTEAEAEAIYRSNYTSDWKGLGAVTRLPLPVFKAWAYDGKKKTEPLGDISTYNVQHGTKAIRSDETVPEGARGVSSHDQALSRSEEQELRRVRGQGDRSLQAVDGELRQLPDGRGSEAGGDNAGSSGLERELRTGQLPVGDSSTTSSQSALLPQSNGGRQGNDDTGGGSPAGSSADDVPISRLEAQDGPSQSRTGRVVAREEEQLLSDIERRNTQRSGMGTSGRTATSDTSKPSVLRDSSGASTPNASTVDQTPADAGVSVSDPAQKATRPVDLIELRKRAAVLKALRKCLEA